MMVCILAIAYFSDLSTYIKTQSEYPSPISLWPGHNIQNTSADKDTIFIRSELNRCTDISSN